LANKDSGLEEVTAAMQSIVSRVVEGKRLSSEAAQHILSIQRYSKEVTGAIGDITSALHCRPARLSWWAGQSGAMVVRKTNAS
jgi:hypothetical protein